MQCCVAMATDEDVDAGHGLGHTHVLSVGDAPVLALQHATVAQTDDHVHLLRLAQHFYHLLSRLDGIGERNRTRADRVELSLFTDHSKDAKANSAALDHE